ncbi:MAG: zinc ABC transporter permease subunit ZnuB [Candidatus Thiodiazotropha taylori]|uniref:High-affinity zinc uptake system membrane protein ZnuB n=1 Tax=Candidatus Thiodiazotropha taylori TaxID=2792791 RepID=A0A9E4N2V3_9GAMM|nr:zinc ABC transporter permease subunit ZnuB [Candidatus Thiodiazotropha taylori]MCG7995277.1 zinc ABC transporter permease subunit ZnuB [Candidatus Thiodiazotropha taylori]MCG8091923.1 zinc ABC transporter permease subunit ZnuB [Candidatus Thiodiazotropha taylori]MCW4255158.1 zinc ABC transporter permease subunit ZnuB [Candidatus Thiodiazotropha taylori]MCW4277303.1 zinc ABC transporter permease subunit ZnuB [Candidatus Thiodiazotropha taylori]
MDDFLLRAVFAGLGVALVTGPLGVFVVWRRMAYFGDTLAHSALLGIALGFLLGINLNLSVILLSILLALLLVGMNRNSHLSHDTQLGILAHSALSLGLVVMAFQTSVRVDLMAYLFGDILAVNATDLLWVWGGGFVVLAILMLIWKPLLSITVHEELAQVEGTPVVAVRIAFMLLIALVIAVSMKIVGVLLVTSMMIIPAAAARNLSRTPEQMALLAAVMGAIAVILGLAGSWQWDTPAGPSVVVAAALLFSVVRIVIPAR